MVVLCCGSDLVKVVCMCACNLYLYVWDMCRLGRWAKSNKEPGSPVNDSKTAPNIGQHQLQVRERILSFVFQWVVAVRLHQSIRHLALQVVNDMLVYCLQQRVMAASGFFATLSAGELRAQYSGPARLMLSQLRHSVCSVPAHQWMPEPAGAAKGAGVPNSELLSHLLLPQTRWAPMSSELLGLLTPGDKMVRLRSLEGARG